VPSFSRSRNKPPDWPTLGTTEDAAYTAKVNIRSIIAPTLSRYPTEYQWDELEDLLRQALSQMPRQTLPEALADEPAKTVIDEWRHRHWLDESAAYLP